MLEQATGGEAHDETNKRKVDIFCFIKCFSCFPVKIIDAKLFNVQKKGDKKFGSRKKFFLFSIQVPAS